MLCRASRTAVHEWCLLLMNEVVLAALSAQTTLVHTPPKQDCAGQTLLCPLNRTHSSSHHRITGLNYIKISWRVLMLNGSVNTLPLNSSLPRAVHTYTDCLSLPHLSRLQHQKGAQLSSIVSRMERPYM